MIFMFKNLRLFYLFLNKNITLSDFRISIKKMNKYENKNNEKLVLTFIYINFSKPYFCYPFGKTYS